MKVGNPQADAARRAFQEEPTLYEAEHAASAFGIALLGPEPLHPESPAPLDSFEEQTQTQGQQAQRPTAPPDVLSATSPWEESTHIPPLLNQPTQALPQLGFLGQDPERPRPEQSTSPRNPAPARHSGLLLLPEPGQATPLAPLTEVRPMPPPLPLRSTEVRRQRLYYPFVVGIIGGLCGLGLALFGVGIIKEQRARVQLSRSEESALKAQRLDLAVSALTTGRLHEARLLLRDYQHRWPSEEVEQILRSLEQHGADRR
ncbi:MAG: hypothetical protein JNM40_05365 [Myxococcales bacterium]|nr:hypothetical protein [Myxococcales bacterium]